MGMQLLVWCSYVTIHWHKSHVVYVAHFSMGCLLCHNGQTQWQQSQYELLTKLSKQFKSEKLVMLGDFNTTGYNIKDEDFTQFEKFLTSSSLKTTSENLGCTSYWEGTLGNGRHQSSILDHIVLNDEMHASIKDIKLGSHCAKLDCKDATPEELGLSYQSVSDHCPLQVTFK
jgi:endonuclease/exonuclease/phosphatase family metal-dependent hydrolase